MKLKIALVGYGKMGKAVETEALGRGHEIVAMIDEGEWDQKANELKNVDVVIEFSHPEAAIPNFRKLIEAGVPVVTGTTGWLDQLEEVRTMVNTKNAAFMYSSNFSPGVNILFQLNKKLATVMNNYPEFDCYIEEAHHRHKKDAPSGTARSLAEQVIEGLDRKNKMVSGALENRKPEAEELSVAFTRAGEIIGKHKVCYISDIEEITIAHEAFNRRGFALGAVLGAEWIAGKRGFFNFAEIFA